MSKKLVKLIDKEGLRVEISSRLTLGKTYEVNAVYKISSEISDIYAIALDDGSPWHFSAKRFRDIKFELNNNTLTI